MADVLMAEPRAGLYQGNLLNVSVRREIADLNRLFLDHALHPSEGADAWFRLPSCAVARLLGAPDEARDRAAECPMALFELHLPGALAVAEAAPVEREPGVTRVEVRRAFGIVVLGVVRRLTEGVPLAPRIAFGLEPEAEARLATMSLSEAYRLAAWPGLIRPRWPDHDRYWSLLAEAVLCGEGLRWAYAAALCLAGPCERQPTVPGGVPQRPARPGHRRPPPASRDLPC